MADVALADDSLLIVSDSTAVIYEFNTDSAIQDESAYTVNFLAGHDITVMPESGVFNVVSQDVLVPLDYQSGIQDAAYDSKMYVRKNGSWLVLDRQSFPTELDSYLYIQVDTLNSFKDLALGETLTPEQRFLSVHDLLTMGMIKRTGTGFTYLQPNVDIVNAGPRPMATPPVPIHIELTESFDYIQLFWEPATNLYANHGHTEIYRSEQDIRSTAINIGNETLSYMHTDPAVRYGVTYYYWLRFVSNTGVVGPWNAVHGIQANTSISPDNVLDVLKGKITEDQLVQDLLDPIKSITGPGGLVETQTDLAQALVIESQQRLAAIAAESQARADALLLEAATRGTAIDEVVTIVNQGDAQLASKIDYVSSVSNGGFDVSKIWQFDTDEEGWTGGTATTAGYLKPSGSLLTSPAFTLDGHKASDVRVRIRKVGNPVWEGTVFYKTDFEPTFGISRALKITEPIFFGGLTTAVWGMKTVGDWDLSIVIGLRLQLSLTSDSSNYFEVDWVGIGREGPGASMAIIAEERTAWSSAIAAEATERNTLAAQMRGTYEGTDISQITQGLIHEEKLARAEADTAIASQFTRIQTGIRPDDPEGELADAMDGWKSLAAFTDEVHTRVTNELAASNRSTVIESRLDDNDASITSIQNTIVTNEEALAQQIEDITAALADNVAAIHTEQVARTTADTAVASSVTSLNAVVVSNNNTLSSAIANEASTRSSADSTLASSISTLQSSVGSNTAAIQTTQNTLATTNGQLAASYTIKLAIDSGGNYYSAGMGIGIDNSSGIAQSSVVFIADRFAVMSAPGSTLTPPFIVQSGNVIINSAVIGNATINFAKITDTVQSDNYVANSTGWRIAKGGFAELQNVKARGDIEAQSLKANTAMVDTLNINGYAVTVAQYAVGSDGSIAALGSSGDIVSAGITMPSGNTGVLITATVGATCAMSSGNANIILGVYKNGSLFYEQWFTGKDFQQLSYTSICFDPSPSGYNTYSLRVRNTADGGGSNPVSYRAPTLLVTGAKR